MKSAKSYAHLIKFGRVLYGNEKYEMPEKQPYLIIQFVKLVEKELLFTPIDDFFSLFPPIKRFKDDGSWDYFSTQKMRKEKLGTHFGKGDLAHLLLTTCYENKYIHELGIGLMTAISRVHTMQTGRSLAMDILEQNGANFIFLPE